MAATRSRADRRRRLAALAVATLLAGVASPMPAQALPDGTRAAMVRTILEQLAAFRRGDWAGAYGYASSAIRARFPLDAFREMVMRGYRPIARSARALVLDTSLADGGGQGWVELRVYGEDGVAIDALYELVDEQGAWRVNGVLAQPVEPGELMRAPDPAGAIGG